MLGNRVAWTTSPSPNSSCGKWGYFVYLDEDKMKYLENDVCIADATRMLFDDDKISSDHSDLAFHPFNTYQWTYNNQVIIYC